MDLEWDERKRRSNIAKHGLDLLDAVLVLDDDFLRLPAHTVGGEVRYRAIGYVRANCVAIIYTMRGDTYRIISMRKARIDERKLHEALLGS